MPKRPTLRALEAEKKLLGLLKVKGSDSSAPLPPVRELGEQLGLSYATVSRLLQRFTQEGYAWQHPNGRFYPVHAGAQAAQGLPIVVLGRQIQHWSHLYREIIEGVSEICTARGCPLVFLSSETLVRHASPEMPPSFAPIEIQATELRRLGSAMPRLCGGLLLDHLWEEKLFESMPFPSAPRLLLARRSRLGNELSVAPDFVEGSRLILEHLARRGCQRVFLGVPFSGDQAVDSACEALQLSALESFRSFPKVESLDCSTPSNRKSVIARLARYKSRVAIICPEDNVTRLLWQDLTNTRLQNANFIELVSIQGTGAFDLPITRLRYDYRRLGRSAVMAVLERQRNDLLIPPNLMIAT